LTRLSPGGITIVFLGCALWIWQSPRSIAARRTTHDEAVLVAPMLKRLGVQRTILVTSAIHMPRSLGTFRAAGVDAIPAPALDPGARAWWTR